MIMMVMMNKNLEILKKSWQKKNILILGFGKEGMDTLKFLKKIFPGKIIAIADQKNFSKIIKKNKNIKLYSGENYLKSIKKYDLIIKSPGIPIHLPEVKKAFKQGKITSQTEIFLKNCPAKIIGVTGTKGKGTTCLMIHAILKKSGLKTYLVGNIGSPPLNHLFSKNLFKNIYVYELSSHQLYNLKKSPFIAVFLNLFKDHLDYYQSFEEYIKAKSNIALWQKKQDYLIYNIEDKKIKEIIKKSKAKKISIKGKYYELNKNAAYSVAQIFKINPKIIEKTFKDFKFSNHRLEMVGIFKGITFYNDSAATIPEATLAAINFLGKKIETIILGGSEKNLNFKKLAQEILKSEIKNLILIPPTGLKIYNNIVRQNTKNKKLKKLQINNMKEAVSLAYKYTAKGKICLLSPASASFGIFKNYKHRGDQFKKYVKFFNRKNL